MYSTTEHSPANAAAGGADEKSARSEMPAVSSEYLAFTEEFLSSIRLPVSHLTLPLQYTEIPDMGLRGTLISDENQYVATWPDIISEWTIGSKTGTPRTSDLGNSVAGSSSPENSLSESASPTASASEPAMPETSEAGASIYILRDIYRCMYIMIPVPHESSILTAGPFTIEPISVDGIARLCRQMKIPRAQMAFLQQYYSTIANIRDYNMLEQYLDVLSRRLYGVDGSLRYAEAAEADMHYSSRQPVRDSDVYEQIEARYRRENEGMRYISRGDMEGADKIFSGTEFKRMAQRASSSLRDRKNYMIVANTLYRKAAEAGGVHPIYLDEISGKFAYRIDRARLPEELDEISHAMIRQYCMLVRSQSTASYSELISKVINYISLHLEEELSLASLAQQFSVNRSYLATRFKQETGHTVTDYINSRRVDMATQLLNRQTGSLQEIAAACGIYNMTYFTRLFRKYRGMTPTEYKKMLSKME